MLSAEQVVKRLRLLQRRYRLTDQRWQEVRAVRKGEVDIVFPDLTSDMFPKPIVANFIDTTARDLAEMLAPLPSFQCSSSAMSSDAARKFADRRSTIAINYVVQSRLEKQMLTGADYYFTYGMLPFYIEPDFDTKLPRITVENPVGGYPEYDRWGRLSAYVKRYYSDADYLADIFPEFAAQILKQGKKGFASIASPNGLDNQSQYENPIEIVRYCDKDQITLVMPLAGENTSVMLMNAHNRLGEVPMVMAHRPWVDPTESKGQFDDIIWVQVVRDLLAKLQYEAVQKSVEAPIALPPDVQEFSYGPDSLIRTSEPDKIRRVGLELPTVSITEGAVLLEEMRQGARYPASRSGNFDASIITGRAVNELQGGLDTQIKSAQVILRDSFVDLIRMCFRMDEKLWPNVDKDIRGQAEGTPYNLKYRPTRDIAKDYSCDVTYGFASGLDINRAVVLLLQLRAEKAFSRDYFVRQLPFQIDVNAEQTKVDVEETREALKQGIYAFVNSIPAMAASGVDPAESVRKVTAIVKGLQKGQPIEDVAEKVFAPPPPREPELPPEALPPELGAPPPEGAPIPPGGPPLPPGGAPGLAGGGRPDLSVMLAGLTGGGRAQMSSRVERRRAI